MSDVHSRGLRNWIAWPGAAFALTSAVLFGASTPFAKLLLGNGITPWLLAGLLYLGSGVGLTIMLIVRRALALGGSEASLTAADLPWLVLIVISGGVVGPLLLMVGLASAPASSASLLLNLEGLATMVIAWIVFRENVDRRLMFGAAAILSGAILLSWQGGPSGFGLGSLAISGACLAWGIDNNLTRRLSASDPSQIAIIKGLAAGTANLALALMAGAYLPSAREIAGAALIGFLGYGVSLMLFVLGLRHLGAARTGAYFSSAPFVGALLSIAIFSEPLTLHFIGAGVLMAVGLYLHLVEVHQHEHTHEAMEHEHRHIHDAHHQHAHSPDDPPGEPHSHRHRHEPLTHWHAHYPDLHHRHSHAD